MQIQLNSDSRVAVRKMKRLNASGSGRLGDKS
jgi:hypothetical protein